MEDMTWWQAVPWPDLGATGLLALVVVMVLTGRLVPRSALTDKAREAEHWRAAYDKRTEECGELREQNATLLRSGLDVVREQGETTVDLLRSMRATIPSDRSER